MANPLSFFSRESTESFKNVWAVNFRLFSELPLFKRFFLLSMLLIILSSATPSLFRWYSGKYSVQADGFTLRNLCLLIGFGVLCRIGAWVSFEITGMWSSQRIHFAMVKSLSHARTTYFDENPSSRLLNKLIADYDQLRSVGIIAVGDFLNAAVEILSIGVIAFLAHPIAGFLVFPLLASFSYIQYHRSAMLSHSRTLSAIASGQVLARQTDVIEGREVFLLYGKAARLLERMAKSFKVHLQATVLTSLIEAWGSFWIRFSAEIFSLVVLLITSLALHQGSIDLAVAGVIISSLFGITGSIGWLDFSTGLVSSSAANTHRVFEIVDLPLEEAQERSPASLKHQTASKPLQTSSDITFENYTMSYRKDTAVILKNLNLVFQGGKKTAIIGRTGSGKTSIIQALLRMVYVHDGDIKIGNSSIFSESPRDLRRVFGVIPQFPYLFEGSIRSNLDLTQKLSDEALKLALAKIDVNYSLDDEITEGGKNLSQGERQLICLARVIASNKSFVIMDEATSSLDPETDAKITQILKSEFQNKTIITIAHRMETVKHYDYFLEIENGQLVRQGEPKSLEI